MRILALSTILLSSSALAQEGGSNRVVGGSEAPDGAWPDAAGIVLNGQFVSCTGTLIAPNLVVTADHCVDPQLVGNARATDVILDETNWIQSESIIVGVAETIRHPRADIALLVLEEDAIGVTPRAIGDGCILDEYLEDGAPVSIVGYGLTNANERFNSVLMEGITSIYDDDCDDRRLGCNPNVPVGSELYAGGDGVDACSGDSGGPLYLLTELGDYLVGVTSRGPQGCRNGAIWVRPDAFVDWMEDETGIDIPMVTCNQPPTSGLTQIAVPQGKTEKVTLEVDDAEDSAFTYTILQAPEHGTVSLGDDGEVTYTADEDYIGADEFWVTVTDTTGFPLQSVSAQVDVEITERSGFLGCSCSSGATPANALWLLGLGGLFLRRRRK